MNKAKYDGKEFSVREVTDLKDLVLSSCTLYPEKTAYLQKDVPGGTFRPILFKTVLEEMNALGTAFLECGLAGQKIGLLGDTCYHWFLSYFATVCGTGVVVPLDKNLPFHELLQLVQRAGVSAIAYSPRYEETVRRLRTEETSLKLYIAMDGPGAHKGKNAAAGNAHVPAAGSVADSADNAPAVTEKDTAESANTANKKNTADIAFVTIPDLLTRGKALLKAGRDDFTGAVIDPHQMASLIFTSGTTGTAKGVMLSHRNIAANVVNMTKRHKPGEGAIVLSFLPAHHTFENTCVDWTTFYQGKTLAICEGIKHITQNMREAGVTHMIGVPLVFEKMYKSIMKQARRRGEEEKLKRAIALSRKLKLYNKPAIMHKMFKPIHEGFGGKVRMFIAGGAAMDPEIIRDFEAMGLPMVQGYGMTECAPIIAVNQQDYSIAESVGRPMPGTAVRIDRPNEEGIGEILCRGPSVMMGYYNDPEATAEALKDGWLHTGDLGYLDANGFLYVTGRKKTVIVTKGGKNIYPEEVESFLKTDPFVKEVMVYGQEDRKIGNVIVSAEILPNYDLVKQARGDLSDSEVYHFFQKVVERCNAALPPYKAIKRITIRKKEFAMTTTGKIKRYGNLTEGGTDPGERNYPAIKAAERKHAEDVIAAIAKSADPRLRYKTGRPITDIRDMFNSSVDLYGDRPLFHQKFKHEEPYTALTYKQVHENVTGLGTALINRGMKGKRIGIIGNTYSQWGTSYLAVIGGVGIVVPLDKELSAADLKYLIKDAEVSAVIFSKKFESMFRTMLAEGDTDLELLINMDAEEDKDGVLSWRKLVEEGKRQLAGGDRQYLDAEIVASDMAVILYTSGTTGFAKGVMLSNTNLVENLMAAPTILNVNPWDIFFSVLPVHHTYECTCAFLMPIYKGASIAFSESLKYVTKNMQEVHPTMMLAVPLLFETIYKRIWKTAKKSGKDAKLRSVLNINKVTSKLGINVFKPFAKDIRAVFGGRMRVLISGGAAINPEILQFFNNAGIITVQGYGLTECSPMTALNPDVRKDMKDSSAGHLLPLMGVKIDDPDEEGIGEICFKGGNIMMGYYNNPAATEEVMEGEWFHTGDLGYVDKDDYIFITGRRKNVIITDNGKNVFPEELEYLLSQIPYVSESMVWGAEDEEKVNSTTIAATILPDAEELEEALGKGYTDEQVQDLLWEAVDGINENLPLFKKIRRVIVRHRDFEKTTGKKIKRFVPDNKEA